ncbi:MAG: lamin tail domain-containing protein [Candidatus Nanopelagicales bacterium]|nr:lamin tail domain-containing protein [Candidatus Nanopelagicales bacterium]
MKWFLGAALLAVGLVAPAPALADDSPPLRPGEQIRERGFVARVTDGDTLRFANTANRRTNNYDVIRLIGVQAPEVARKGFHAGECNGDLAQAVLVDIAEGHRAVLASMHDTRDSSRDRKLRTVYVQDDDGNWVDLAAEMLRRGWGQWFPKKTEPVHNLQYRELSEAAQAEQLNIWNPTNCGDKYATGVPLQMWIQPDPSGNDWDNVNGEYIRIANMSADTAADLSGWSLRDGSLHWLRFPSGTVIGANDTLVIRVGEGRSDSHTLYWGRKRPVFSNLGVTKEYMGDGAYLIDRQGNVRAYYIYPCLGTCDDPRMGSVVISKVRDDPPGNEVRKPNQEFVRISNRGTQTFPMVGYEMRIGGWTREFGVADTLAPGSSLTVRIGKGRDHSTTRFFGMPHSILNNTGDLVSLRSFDARVIDCYAYGQLRSRRCN